MDREYSNKGQNITLDKNLLNDSYFSVVAAMSNDNRIEHLYLHDGSINMERFNVFLKQLRKKLGDDKVYLFMDNLMVHRGSLVMPMYDELNFVPIWNVKYSPDFNPIETVFA